MNIANVCIFFFTGKYKYEKIIVNFFNRYELANQSFIVINQSLYKIHTKTRKTRGIPSVFGVLFFQFLKICYKNIWNSYSHRLPLHCHPKRNRGTRHHRLSHRQNDTNMKKSIISTMKAITVIMFASVITLMASCSTDDDTTNGKIAGCTATITVTPSEDAQDICETTIEYTDTDGNTRHESVCGGIWMTTVDCGRLPFEGEITITQTLRPGTRLSQSSYRLGAEIKTTYAAHYTSGIVDSKAATRVSSNFKTVKKDLIGSHAQTVTKKYTVTSSASGGSVIVRER